jgi:hypothetical protein
VKETYRQDLERLCRSAHEKGIVVVAAARGPGDHVYPGIFKTVIGVYWNRQCEGDSMVYHPGNDIEFGAHGQPRALPGLPQDLNFRGSSFAAARVTATAARLLQQNPAGGLEGVMDVLIERAKEDMYHHCQRTRTN